MICKRLIFSDNFCGRSLTSNFDRFCSEVLEMKWKDRHASCTNYMFILWVLPTSDKEMSNCMNNLLTSMQDMLKILKNTHQLVWWFSLQNINSICVCHQLKNVAWNYAFSVNCSWHRQMHFWYVGKGKGKVHPRTGHEGPKGVDWYRGYGATTPSHLGRKLAGPLCTAFSSACRPQRRSTSSDMRALW